MEFEGRIVVEIDGAAISSTECILVSVKTHIRYKDVEKLLLDVTKVK